MSKLTKIRLIKYGVTGIVGALMAVLVLWIKDFSFSMPLLAKYLILTDAFTIPGVLLIMFGFLAIIASMEFFYGLSYAFRRVVNSFIPVLFRDHVTYYEYVMEKREKKKSGQSYGFLFITGCFFMVIAIVFYVLFYQIYPA